MEASWGQVLAWRLSRHFLDPRAENDAVDVVSRLCGVQAQVASAAALAVRLRGADPAPALADAALLKVWAMRGTLHLLPAAEAADHLALAAAAESWHAPAWQRAFGATPAEVEALVEAVSALLDDAVLTREQLAEALVADKRFANMAEQLRSGWGTLIKVVAWHGALCHAPGTKTAFTRPASLVPGWGPAPDPAEAGPRVVAAYLGAYGPAAPEAFSEWLLRGAHRKTAVRRWFADLGDAVTTVEVEGRELPFLAEHVDALAAAKPLKASSVRLLGAFDQYVLGPGTKAAEVLPAAHRARVSRAAGWIAPLLVHAGRVTGTWETADGVLTVTPFADAPPDKPLRAEAAVLGRALGEELDVVVAR